MVPPPQSAGQAPYRNCCRVATASPPMVSLADYITGENASFITGDDKRARIRGVAGLRRVHNDLVGGLAQLHPRILVVFFFIEERLFLGRVEERRGFGCNSNRPVSLPPLIKPDGPISGIRLSDRFHQQLTDGSPNTRHLDATHPTFRTRCCPKTWRCLAKTPYGVAS